MREVGVKRGNYSTLLYVAGGNSGQIVRSNCH